MRVRVRARVRVPAVETSVFLGQRLRQHRPLKALKIGPPSMEYSGCQAWPQESITRRKSSGERDISW